MAVERIEFKKVSSATANIYHVPAVQWRKWGLQAGAVFNRVYSSMLHNQELYRAPNAEALSRREWKVVAWNAAWTAATAARTMF